MTRPERFDLPTLWFENQHENAMLMILLAPSCTTEHGLVRAMTFIGPISDLGRLHGAFSFC
jgi:hypothetical protein